MTDAEVLKQYEKKERNLRPTLQEASDQRTGQRTNQTGKSSDRHEGHKGGALPSVPGNRSGPPGDKSLIGSDNLRPEAKPEPKNAKEPEKAGTPSAVKKAPTEPARTESKQPPKTEPTEPAKTEPSKAEPKSPDKAKDPKGNSSAGRASPFRLTSMLAEEKADEKKPPEAPAEAGVVGKARHNREGRVAFEVSFACCKGGTEGDGSAEGEGGACQGEGAETGGCAAAVARRTDGRDARRYEDGDSEGDCVSKDPEDLRCCASPWTSIRRSEGSTIPKRSTSKHDNKEIPPPPQGPDFEKLAKENGISAVRFTGLVPLWEALRVGHRDVVGG